MKFECTNCGGVGPAFWVTVGALAIAAVALYFSYAQHRELLRRLRARARFRVTLSCQGADQDGVVRTSGNVGNFRVAIGIDNEGDRAAGPTLINALFPQHLQEVRWCGPNGEESEAKSDVAAAGEGDVVVDDKGQDFEASYLNRTLPRVGTRPHHACFFQFHSVVPDTGELSVPVRVKVQADEIPDNIDEYERTLLVRIQRS